jgi:23S rRNA maturation-related 3'-5' exoribonuclease YhaM
MELTEFGIEYDNEEEELEVLRTIINAQHRILQAVKKLIEDYEQEKFNFLMEQDLEKFDERILRLVKPILERE